MARARTNLDRRSIGVGGRPAIANDAFGWLAGPRPFVSGSVLDPAWTMSTALVMAVAVAVVAAASAAEVGSSSVVAAGSAPPTDGRPWVLDGWFRSESRRREVPFRYLLPPGYDAEPGRRYPVLYWLHDRPGEEPARTLPPEVITEAIERRIIPPMIVVYSHGGEDSFYVDAPDGGPAAESAVVRELIPHVDRTFRTRADRGNRAIQGCGMGGFGAVRIALAQPEAFASGLAVSGSFPSVDDFATNLVRQRAFRVAFGGDRSRVATNQPAYLAERNRDRLRGRTFIRLVTTRRGAIAEENRDLRDALRTAQAAVEWQVVADAEEGTELARSTAWDGVEFAAGTLGAARAADRDGPWVNPPTNRPPRVRHSVLCSAMLDRPIGYSLYLPPGREAHETNRLPVIYHLHGRGEDESRWLETVGYLDTAIRLGEVGPAAWVWPYGGRGSWYVDSVDGRVPAESVLIREVIPAVEARWHLGGDGTKRALDGWGMGAFGAARLAATYPGMFGAVLLHHPLLPDAIGMSTRFPDGWITAFDANVSEFAGRDPSGWFTKNADALRSSFRIRLVVGAGLAVDARRLQDRLNGLRLTNEYEELPGSVGTGPDLFRRTGLKDLRFLLGPPSSGSGP